MLPPEAGIPLIRRELTAGATRGEIVIGQRLGILLNEWDATGGLDAGESPAAPASTRADGRQDRGHQRPAWPHHRDDARSGTSNRSCTITRSKAPRCCPGSWGSRHSRKLLCALLPGWSVESVEDVNFLAPFKFYRNEPRKVEVRAQLPSGSGRRLVADCRLIGQTHSAEPDRSRKRRLHFTGRVRLARQKPGRSRSATAPEMPARPLSNSATSTACYFHGPAYRVLEKAWWDGERVVGRWRRSARQSPPSGAARC